MRRFGLREPRRVSQESRQRVIMKDETETRIAQNEAAPHLGSFATVVLGGYLIILGPVMVYLLMALWPRPYVVPAGLKDLPVVPMSLFGFSFVITHELRLLGLVVLGGAMGSYLRSAISFASFAETGNMPKSTWWWWCVLQTYIGMLLACIFYFIMRGIKLPMY